MCLCAWFFVASGDGGSDMSLTTWLLGPPNSDYATRTQHNRKSRLVLLFKQLQKKLFWQNLKEAVKSIFFGDKTMEGDDITVVGSYFDMWL
jgi:hypothetical protein